jgi:hypothetical protein
VSVGFSRVHRKPENRESQLTVDPEHAYWFSYEELNPIPGIELIMKRPRSSICSRYSICSCQTRFQRTPETQHLYNCLEISCWQALRGPTALGSHRYRHTPTPDVRVSMSMLSTRSSVSSPFLVYFLSTFRGSCRSDRVRPSTTSILREPMRHRRERC